MFKIFIKAFSKYCLVLWPLTLLGYIILPILMLFISKDKDELPKFFSIWDNFSGPGVDGLAGDSPFRVEKGMGYKVPYDNTDIAQEMKYKNPFWADAYYVEDAGWFKLYWRRVVWSAFRNAVDMGKATLLGVETTDYMLTNQTESKTGDVDNHNPGTVHRYSNYVNRHSLETMTLEEFYFISKPWNLFGKKVVHRLRMGFKTEPGDLSYQSSHERYKNRKFVRFVFSYSPIQPYEGAE